MYVFGLNCYLRGYLALKLLIPYVILKKLRFQYFLSITCYNATKLNFIIDCVSVMPIDDLSNGYLNISASSRDTKF